jgi:hypothetical protein
MKTYKCPTCHRRKNIDKPKVLVICEGCQEVMFKEVEEVKGGVKIK